jgi:hypothetical protein
MAVTRRRKAAPAAEAAAEKPAKAAPKAKAKGGVSSELSATEERAARNEALTKQIVKLRDSGSKWQEISDEVGVAVGRAIFLYEAANVDDKDRIRFKNDEDLAGKLLKLRGTTSWGRLSQRTGVGEAKLKRLYAEAGGDVQRIGKGGRHAGAEGASAAKSAPRTRTKAAKPAAEKAALAGPRRRVKK